LDNNYDILRDPIWQFVGVVIGVIAIFMAYLTLPSSVQGTTLVMIVVTTIALLLIFVKNKAKRLLLTCAFFLAGYIWCLLIDGLTYYQMPFFREIFGLTAPGVIYAKSDIGLALIVIEYILWTTTLLLCLYFCLAKKNYVMALSEILIYICLLFFSIPNLYIPNFLDIKILIVDFGYPKTTLGLVIYMVVFLGFILLFLSGTKKPSHFSKKLSQKQTRLTM